MLSPMQEIFILLEDEKEVPFFRLNRWGRPARGVLAKLKNLGWVEKIKRGQENYYRITQKGEDYADEILSNLKIKKSWDGKWRLVMFEIPEKQRTVRDKLRRALNDLGLGILQSSVWISPQDVKQKIDLISQKLKLGNQLKYFEVDGTPGLNQQIISKSWDLAGTSDELDNFIREAERSLKVMGKGNGDRFNAKKLIFNYALIMKKDPKLPLEFVEKNETRKKALDIYQKLRAFII